MADVKIYATEPERESAVLLGVHVQKDQVYDFESTMEELHALSDTCKLDVSMQFTQNKAQIDQRYYVGKGKLDEVKDYVTFNDIDVVVVNDELTAAQSKHLNAVLEVKIIDRTQLILEIFAMRAHSKEGKLQVERAQLEYLLPRLQGHGKSLSRLGGGIGTRGPGETKLELDRRHIRTRINEIKRQLETVEAHRARYRDKRRQNQVFHVALVGYTNAGKSSWFNVLANEATYEKDQLFATLDPKTRQIQINGGFNLIISDTVGFIQKLPTTLIEAFKSTLEEAKNADVLLHVVDASHPQYRTQYDTVQEIIADLDMAHIEQVVVFNKKDSCDASEIPISPFPNVFVSSRDASDRTEVITLVREAVKRLLTYYEETVPASDANRLYFLKQNTMVTSLIFDETTSSYHVTGYKTN